MWNWGFFSEEGAYILVCYKSIVTKKNCWKTPKFICTFIVSDYFSQTVSDASPYLHFAYTTKTFLPLSKTMPTLLFFSFLYLIIQTAVSMPLKRKIYTFISIIIKMFACVFVGFVLKRPTRTDLQDLAGSSGPRSQSRVPTQF